MSASSWELQRRWTSIEFERTSCCEVTMKTVGLPSKWQRAVSSSLVVVHAKNCFADTLCVVCKMISSGCRLTTLASLSRGLLQ